MFKSFSVLTTAFIVCFSSVAFADGDELFSEFQSGSVFTATGDDSESDSKTAPKRIVTAEDLRELLKKAGFDAKVASGRAASAKKELAPWTFPVLAILSEDEAHVSLVLGLATIKNVSTELPAEKLLKMMEASQQNSPTLFVYHSKRERTEVSVTLKNKGLTGEIVRDEINRMAVLAKKTATVWSNQEQKNALNPVTPAEKPTTASVNLTGKWSAAKSDKEAFAVEFTTDGKFNLVYINNGQQTKSSGSFTVANSSLTLSGSQGLKLQGKLTMTSATEFRFEPKGSSALVFKKAGS